MCDVYERIDELCRKKGVSGYRMCKDLGIAPSTITELRKGRQNSVNADKAAKIAEYFAVSVSYLLGKEEIGIKKEPAPKDELDAELVRLLSELPSSELPLVLAFVQGLAAKRGG